MFCENCGANIEGTEKFCPACGAPITRQALAVPAENRQVIQTKTPTTTVVYVKSPPVKEEKVKKDKKKKKKSHKGLIAFVIIAIIALGTLGVAWLVLYDSDSEVREFNHNPATAPADLNVNIDLDIGSVVLTTVDPADQPAVYIKLTNRWAGVVVGERELNPNFAETADTVTFTLQMERDVSWVWGYNEIKVEVVLRRDIAYDLDIQTDTGSVNFAAGDVPMTFNALDIHTDTGSIDANLGQGNTYSGYISIGTDTGSLDLIVGKGTSVQGYLKATTKTGSMDFLVNSASFSQIWTKTDTGSQDVRLDGCTITGEVFMNASTGSFDIFARNLTLSPSVNFYLGTKTGSFDADIIQSESLGATGTFNWTIQTDTGSVDVTFRGKEAYIGANFRASADTGSIDLNNRDEGFKNSVANTMETRNFQTIASKYDITIMTDTGSVDVDAWNL